MDSTLFSSHDFIGGLTGSEKEETLYSTFKILSGMEKKRIKKYLTDTFSTVGITKILLVLLRPIRDKLAKPGYEFSSSEKFQSVAVMAYAVHLFELLEDEVRDRVIRLDPADWSIENASTLGGDSLSTLFAYPALLQPFVHCMTPEQIAFVLYDYTNEKASQLVKHFPKTLPGEMAYLILISPLCTDTPTKIDPERCEKIFRREPEQLLLEEAEAYNFNYKGACTLEIGNFIEWVQTVRDWIRTFDVDDDLFSEAERAFIRDGIQRKVHEWVDFQTELCKLEFSLNNASGEVKA